MKKLYPKLRFLLILLCLGLIALSSYQILRQLLEYRQGSSAYESLEQYVSPAPVPAPAATSAASSAASSSDRTAGEVSAASPEPALPTVDFEALRQINPEIVGWLYGAEGRISYPVAQAADNDYYLNHLYTGAVNSSGCLFLDYRSTPTFTDLNSVIYGHNMKNGTMFAALQRYKSADYYRDNPTMLLFTPEGTYTVALFSGYLSQPDDEDTWRMFFENEEDCQRWLDKLCRRSCFDSGLHPTPSDTILTLSTCSYEFEEARFVVYGILQ